MGIPGGKEKRAKKKEKILYTFLFFKTPEKKKTLKLRTQSRNSANGGLSPVFDL
jgi:hypothetical protein